MPRRDGQTKQFNRTRKQKKRRGREKESRRAVADARKRDARNTQPSF